jgi:lysophospholipase L1-like esterase
MRKAFAWFAVMALFGGTAVSAEEATTAAATATGAATAPAAASFADFDRRARAGETLTVVFFGCSLTWGADSTDPVETSYRAVVARKLAERYPRAHVVCHDAAIGGTDSRLGVFRFARDVARRKPDLVFMDFTLNDDSEKADPDHLASYEAILRRAIGELHVPVVQMILCSKDQVACLDLTRFKTRTAHLQLAQAYHAGVGDALALMQERLRAGKLDLDQVWDNPEDGTHPGDLGYALYAEAAMQGFDAAVAGKLACQVPAAWVNASTYGEVARVPLVSLAPLPAGWAVAKPNRTAAWYDSQMSRWLDDEARATKAADGPNPGTWTFSFRGATVFLYGEANLTGGKLRVQVDGQAPPGRPDGILDCRTPHHDTSKLAVAIATGLDPTIEHTLMLAPAEDRPGPAEWRIESVCVAGPGATVAVVR